MSVGGRRGGGRPRHDLFEEGRVNGPGLVVRLLQGGWDVIVLALGEEDWGRWKQVTDTDRLYVSGRDLAGEVRGNGQGFVWWRLERAVLNLVPNGLVNAAGVTW